MSDRKILLLKRIIMILMEDVDWTKFRKELARIGMSKEDFVKLMEEDAETL